jgi:hypothetical protein
MKLTEAQETLRKAVSDYEDGVISLPACLTIINVTTRELWDAGYDAGFTMGLTEAELDDSGDDEDEYELELEDLLEDDQDDLNDPDDFRSGV